MKIIFYIGILIQIIITVIFYEVMRANGINHILTYLAYILVFAAIGKLILRSKITNYHKIFSILTSFFLINSLFIIIFYLASEGDEGGLLFLYQFPIAAILIAIGLTWIITTIIKRTRDKKYIS